MFKLSRLRLPGLSGTLIPGILFALFVTFPLADSASAYVDKTVRWTRSPLRDAQGLLLPPAVTYEVWLRQGVGTEYLAATVPDTSYVLRALPGVTYYLRVRGVSAAGQKSVFSETSDPYRSSEVTDAPPEQPAAFGPAYPNPFNARTTITYRVPEGLPAGAPLALEIFDARGRRLHVFEIDRDAGDHQVLWDGRDDGGRPVPAGMYLARFVCGDYVATAKLTLVP